MNILIIKLGALGDVVMATPLVEAIQKHHPDANCHLLTTPAFAPIFSAWPRLRVAAYPRRGWRNTLNVVRFIRRLDCAVLYDLQGNDRSGVWTACSGAPVRVGNHPRFPYTHHPATPWTGQQHIFDRMIEILASAGVRDVESTPRLPLDDAERAGVDAWMTNHELEPRSFAVLHAGASAARPEKRWPYFEPLGRRLAESGVTPVWLGAEPEREENRRLVRAAGGIDATGEFSINALAELGRRARFAVTNDSGPMHVLAAAGIPVFGLFGPSDWQRNHALGQSGHVIACVRTCPEFAGLRTGKCLDRIPVDLVWTRLGDAGVI